MILSHWKIGFALLATTALGMPLPAQQTLPQATLQIDVNKPLHAVSPMLYGLMTEEINYSYDGGLYAEMVRNRVFRERDLSHPAHWYLVQGGESSGSMQLDRTTGPSSALQSSLLIDVKQADSKNQVGVLNEGYWGMALRPKTTYHGSFYAKADAAGMGAITVALKNNNSGAVLATTQTAEPATEWKKYDFTLVTGAMAVSSENHLQLTVGHAGKLWLDLVSLMPPTYKDRANGNRIDLMEKLAAMHPSFLRMPGGNYLEGDQIDERFEWKTTIGPLVDRPTHRSPWNYQSSDGLGLLEFLEWTEDLKIQPLLAVYAGYSLKGDHIEPGPALTPYVEDALDEIEFVTGDAATTHWGGVRASLGHPAPFPLTYVEIGNEDWFDRSGSYEARFAQFAQAIKAKYPKLQLIATDKLKTIKPDVQDDHYYLRAGDIFHEAKRYDGVDRNGPKIFVGEWATREGSPTSNFGAALGDAAWMTGMERNSDLIIMASYAPLFVNVNPGGMQWESDLIGYDALESYGSPSYYAQAMFAESLGTEVPTSSMTGAGGRFFYSTTMDQAKGTVQIKLVNASSDAQPVEIALGGVRKVAQSGSLVSLTGTNATETNTLAAPVRVVPVRTKLAGTGSRFSHTVPPYTIEVMELRAEPGK